MLAATSQTHYATLRVRSDASTAEIERAYRACLATAPSRGLRGWLAWVRGDDIASLAEAHATLSDPVRRADYDRQLNDRSLLVYRCPWL